jgi:hypothetical protein
MDRGTGSMKGLLSTVLFSIGPALFDVLVAAVYLSTRSPGWSCDRVDFHHVPADLHHRVSRSRETTPKTTRSLRAPCPVAWHGPFGRSLLK